MGKKNRRKKGDKQERKERLEERRERLNEIVEREEEVDDEIDTRRNGELFVGDRAWINEGPGWWRGVVKVVGHVTKILHADAEDREDLYVSIPANSTTVRIQRDFSEWTLRFDVDDSVVCFNGQYWEPSLVTELWLVDHINGADVPPYQCRPEFDTAVPPRFNVATEDSDDHIMRHSTTFRFSVGDNVIFASAKAAGLGNRSRNEPWIHGEVTKVDVVNRSDIYAVYECSYKDRNKVKSCFILKDDDEHVTSPSASPRERLLGSIEQDCGYAHFDYLINSSGLDFMAVRDLLLSTAIESASYDALLWLQENAEVQLERIRDADNNGLLHQIAKSPHAERFFASAVEKEWDRDEESNEPYIKLDGLDRNVEERLFRQVNSQGRTFLHELIISGHKRALDLALSRGRGLGWALSFCITTWNPRSSSPSDIHEVTRDERGLNLKDTARLLARFDMEKMVDEFVAFHVLYRLTSTLANCFGGGGKKQVLDTDTLAKFAEDSDSTIAKRVIRFYEEWGESRPQKYSGMHSSIEGAIVELARYGSFEALSWLIDEEPSLLKVKEQPWGLSVNKNEFSQHPLDNFAKPNDQMPALNLVGFAALGGSLLPADFDQAERDSYINMLRGYMRMCERTRLSNDCKPFASYIEQLKERNHRNYKLESMLRQKLQILRDDETLSGRLKVLGYLVNEKGMPPPNVLSVIEWRQCGVLRWLVENSFIDLQGPACKDLNILRDGKKLVFLGGRKIPRSMTVGEFLCFTAIEFDDLQSFEWLVNVQNIDLSPIRFEGLNVVHFCACLGRAEIVLWMMVSAQSTLKELAREECTRRPWSGYFAAHIAAEKGFTFVADILLSSGCPLTDSNGKTVFGYAKQSKMEAVRVWGKKLELPFRLEKDIEKLLRLVSVEEPLFEDIKKHILKSKCMEPSRWRDCGFADVDTPGPVGKTYREVLDHCCALSDPDFIVSLCRCLSPSSDASYNEEHSWISFWLQDPYASSPTSDESLGRAALMKFAVDQDNDVLCRALTEPWTRDFACKDPWKSDPLLGHLLTTYQAESPVLSALTLLRDELLCVDALGEVVDNALSEIRRLFTRGSHSGQINDMIHRTIEVAAEFDRRGGHKEKFFTDWEVISADGRINLETNLPGCEYDKDCPLRGMMIWEEKPPVSVERLFVVLGIEGYSELISWVRSEGRSNWDAEMEASVVRIAAFMGHSDVVDIILKRGPTDAVFLPESECYKEALLGAAEAGRVSDAALYWYELEKMGSPLDPLVCDLENLPDVLEYKDRDRRRDAVASSLVGTAVRACITSADDSSELSLAASDPINDKHLAVVNWIVSNTEVNGEALVHAASFVLCGTCYSVRSYEQCIEFLAYLAYELQIDILHCQEDIQRICNEFISLVDRVGHREVEHRNLEAVAMRLLSFLSKAGFDLLPLKFKGNAHFRNEMVEKIESILKSFQAEQVRAWSQFDMIKDGRSLEEIQQAVDNGEICLTTRYRGGFLFTHLAAVYDRLDVLQWLIEVKGMPLDALDSQGRPVLAVAQASNAVSVTDWIVMNTAGNVVAAFVSSHFRRRRALERTTALLWCIRTIQALYRGFVVRRAHRARLLSRLDETQRFDTMWEASILLLTVDSLSGGSRTWQLMKQQEHDVMRSVDVIDDEEMFAETTQKLKEAAVWALSETNAPPMPLSVEDEEKGESASRRDAASLESPPENCASINLTSDVVKWLRRSGSKYRDFFVRRMKQLAAGDRSRILAKRLTGSETLIYETYLEQKSGQRILWTDNSDGGLLIWYVAKHKSVSRLMGLIDDAENRSSRQLTSASALLEMNADVQTSEGLEAERIMLDPLGDTPLKLYEVYPEEIEKLSDPAWKPRLHLTERERKVVETPGTVLLLGRSGTGKTCVIGNRMDYDRQRARDDSGGFSQLFVARSQGLCDYVKEAVDGENNAAMRFDTFAEVVSSLEGSLPLLSNTASSETGESVFLPSRKMDFTRFKRDFYRLDSSCSVDALVVWANIRSFIKGSIEALLSKEQALKEDEYLNLGKKRCRLSPEQRKSVFATFERYDKYMKDIGLWDDCDRITALARRLEHARASDSLVYQEVRYNKLYVDEVQDYTQAEIAVFFYLCGPGDLFLAGDPAQSVVEGVEFRFEEIRSVGYHLYGEERRHLIPDKPKTVHVNFRSHCGILNVAAAVLSCLFRAFPDSAKQLKEDRGLFQGPRPGVFHKVEAGRLQELVSKRDGIVVLTHDRNVSKWTRLLKDYPLVYGIREAKGLEFQEVILVDFFVDIPASLQKLWRNLLLGRDVTDIGGRPEIEGHLKLLYTAITRCIQRLFFAETSSSVAGDAFVRWLTTNSTTRSPSDAKKSINEALAVKNSVENVEKMIRTPDEWRSAGLDNAVMAESAHELSEMETWLDRALYCFEQVGDSALASRARTHRASIRFRQRLADNEGDATDAAQTELDAALLTEQLLSERLHLEAKETCTAIMPLLGERGQENLQSRIISRIPS